MEPGAIESAKILVVDDEPHVIAIIEAALASGGYRKVLTTSRSAEVLELYHREAPDLIIMDMKMPGVHGMAIIEELHDVVPAEDYLPILVVTGDQNVDRKLRALAWGAKDFLAKPFEVPELLLRVRMLLETRLLFHRVARSDRR
jgi:putative two-component system response regulator